MKFVAQFFPATHYDDTYSGWRIIEFRSGMWRSAAKSQNVPSFIPSVKPPGVLLADGDFEDEAETLQEFIDSNIERFL